jgi:subtilisin family serine protease
MPWTDNLAWDDAIAQSADIVIGGDRTTEFAYRPRQLVCGRDVWEAPRNTREERVRGRLADANASLVADNPPNDRERRKADLASDLDLRLLDVPDGDIPRLVDDAREEQVVLAPHYVLFANPQRHGGCSPPTALAAPSAIVAAPDAGQGIRIAVLDTGMPEPPNVVVEPFAPEHVEPADAGPARGHGTMVAGVIARAAPGATIVVRRVLETPLGVADELDVVAALADLPPDIDIVNASFGGRAAPDGTMAIFKRAVESVRPETLVVASAGNEGERRPHFMAAFKRVLSVASVTQTEPGRWELEDYSNRGWWIDLSTVGTDVETVDHDGSPVLCSGTSFAAPQVAARVAVDASAGGVPVIEAARLLAAGLPVIPDGGTVV